MVEVRTGGNRRIDRVLAEDFVDGVGDLPLDELRRRRREAEQEEVDLSYLRRMLHGRLDLLVAESRRRAAGSDSGPLADLVTRLSEVLGDEERAPTRGLARHVTAEPSRVDDHRRYAESLVADPLTSDLAGLDDEALAAATASIEEQARSVSAGRRAVQDVVDRLGAEVARRYRDGEVDVADVLGAVGGSSDG